MKWDSEDYYRMDHYWMEFDIKPSPWWRNRDMEGTGGMDTGKLDTGWTPEDGLWRTTMAGDWWRTR